MKNKTAQKPNQSLSLKMMGAIASVSFMSALGLAQSDATTPATPSTATADTSAAGPTDAQIEKIVVTSNNVEIDMSKLAKDHAQNKDVKKLAEHMISDHEKWNKEADSLAKKIKTAPEESADSRAVEADGKRIMDRLSALQGNDFDKAYTEEGVKFHQGVLKAIDQKLLPNAKNGDLKKMLEKTRPKVQAHLDHENKVRSEMKL